MECLIYEYFFFTKPSISKRVLNGYFCFIKINYIIFNTSLRNSLQVCLEDTLY